MKYKVIAEILDGVIAATKSEITCFVSNTLHNEWGGPIDVRTGDILSSDTTDNAETYWSYSKKEWDKMDKSFRKLWNK
jgi:hypothetical protein